MHESGTVGAKASELTTEGAGSVTPRTKPAFRLIVSPAAERIEENPVSSSASSNTCLSSQSSSPRHRNLLPLAQALSIKHTQPLMIDSGEDGSASPTSPYRISKSESSSPMSCAGNSQFAASDRSFGAVTGFVSPRPRSRIEERFQTVAEDSLVRRKPQELSPELKTVLANASNSPDHPLATSFQRIQYFSDNSFQINQYRLATVLSSSLFSTTYQAQANDAQFTVKEFDKDKMKLTALAKKHSIGHSIDSEIEVLIACSHPNIAKLYEVIASPDSSKVYLVTDWLSRGSLADVGKVTEAAARAVFKQVFTALAYLHDDLHIALCNLTLASILLDHSGLAKISDFSCAKRFLVTSEKARIGKKEYVSPETVSAGSNEGKPQGDMWAAGAALFWCVAGYPPFQGKTLGEMFKAIQRDDVKAPDSFSPQLLALVLSLLEKDPSQRLTASQALSDSWFHI